MSISDKVFEVLKEKHITQKEFSERTGIPQSTISDWKKKGNTPSADKIMTICEVLDISPYELLGKGNIRRKDVDLLSMEGMLIETISGMTQEQKNRVLGYAVAIKELGN